MINRIAPLLGEGFIFGVLSQKRKTSDDLYDKVQIKPFLKEEALCYQFTYVYPKKVLHRNFSEEEATAEIALLLTATFHQGVLYTATHDYHLLSFGKLKIKTQEPTRTPPQDLSHNSRRNYILQEEGAYPFLIRLGVMGKDGRVLKTRYDKFRQINKYLELVASCIPSLPKDRRLRIVDFGCGKSYLTFALYHYLVEMLGLEVEIIGLDLKEDVVAFCNQVAQDLHYSHLAFLTGDIRGYKNSDKVDMVVTLHACDTATDDAIVQAVGWGTEILLTVPCCQHELFDKIQAPEMELLTKHGILKERQSALITDAIRGQLLEACGYEVNIMEFISMEHTPKNLLIKGVRKGRCNRKAYGEFRKFADFWHIHPYLEQQLLESGLLAISE